MFSILMNNTHTLHIDNKASRTASLKLIKEAIDSSPGIITIDMLDVKFPLHRDFFLVLSRKFPRDRYVLLLKSENAVLLAHSLWIQAKQSTFSSEFQRDNPEFNLVTHNMTMWEYFLYECRRGYQSVKYKLFNKRWQEEKMPHFKKNHFQLGLIITGLVASFVLLLFIFHFAISKTTITITPEVTVRPITANIIYRMEGLTGSILDTRNSLKLKKITLPVETEMTFKVNSIDQNSAQNARGMVTIYNELTVVQELRPQTRFVTADGIVFRTTGWAKIPASRSLNWVTEMGVTEVLVEADIKDESWKIIGSKGNISAGTDLSIPWLKFNRDKVYAKAKENFIWGADPSVHILTQEELNNFQNTIKEKLEKESRDSLNNKLASDKTTTGEDYAMLVVDTIKFSPVEFEIISGQKVGDVTDEIQIKAKNTITATAMDRKATIDYLTSVFRENLLQWTNKELWIHTDTLRVSNVVSRNEDDTEIKATLEMNTSTTYDLENSTNDLTRRLKVLIAGLSKDEARSRLIEEWYVKDVKIENYPFWIKNVSTNLDNIEFYIQK